MMEPPAPEVVWLPKKIDKVTRRLSAEFGSGKVVTVEEVKDHWHDLLPRVWHIACEHVLITVEHAGYCAFDFRSNLDEVSIRWREIPHSGRVVFGSEERFKFDRDSVGHVLIESGGRRILRQAPPWKDRHIEAGVDLVVHLEVAQPPWPETGIACALMRLIEVATKEILSRNRHAGL